MLTDVNMPDMDGFMLADEIRQTGWVDAIIIVLTSGGQIGDSERRESIGIAAELLKPVKQSELLDSILQAVAPLTGHGSTSANQTETMDEQQKVDSDKFPLHAITQRPMPMYHSWDSQNAWLRQIMIKL